jgi:PAS domain S-box-containing protein
MMLAIDNLGTTGAAAPCAARIDKDTGYEDFQCMAEASAAMISTADKSGLCTFANQRWLELRGRTLAEESGTGWSEGIHPEDSRAVMAEYWTAVNARTPLRVEYRLLCADGAYRTVEHLISPWRSADGELRGYIGCLTLPNGFRPVDIAARHLLASLSARERQVMELIATGFSTRAISNELKISYKTADSHRTHLLKKLNMHETASLVRFAIRTGAVEP